MNKLAKGNTSTVRFHNTMLILHTIRETGMISRYDISKRTRLSPTTVAALSKDLLEYKYVSEMGKSKSTGGRQGLLLGINSKSYCFIAIQFNLDILELALIDFGFNRIATKRINLKKPMEHDEFTRLILDNIADEWKKNLLGIGIGSLGVVDPQAGVIHSHPLLAKPDYKIRDTLVDALHYNVSVINTGRITAWSAFLSFPNVNNLLCVDICHGIGAGMVINRQVHKGSNFAAGEIGHSVFTPEGKPCYLPHNGCLEQEANAKAFLDAARQAAGDVVEIEELDNCYLTNREAKKLMDEKLDLLGYALAFMVDLLDPDIILITGRIFRNNPVLFGRLCESISCKSFLQSSFAFAKIRTYKFEDDMIYRGLANLIWNELTPDAIFPEPATGNCKK